jgi:hypothetical protein
MMKKTLLILLLGLGHALLLLNCGNSTEPKKTSGTLTGSVKSSATGNAVPIVSAYIFWGDSLLATTDNQGNYSVASLVEGSHSLTCSALGYRDSTAQVRVDGGKAASHNFVLAPDSSTGRVYGEFEDMTLYSEALQANPALASWDSKQMFSGVTGATLQGKYLGYELPPRQVLLGDSILALADDFGQFWFEIQSGTYPIKASCEGYHSDTQVIRVLSGERQYATFFMVRK